MKTKINTAGRIARPSHVVREDITAILQTKGASGRKYHVVLALVGAAIASLLPMVDSAKAEEVGVSVADLPNLLGRFIVRNSTTYTINYRIKWGSNSEWKSFSLAPGKGLRHSHPLTNGRAPSPYLSFDTDSTGGKFFKTYDVNFGNVGFAGYPRGHVDDPVRYEFSQRGSITALVKQ